MSSVADPGFPGGGGANSPGGGGRQHTILRKFPKNCMKLKEFGPPLRSATGHSFRLANQIHERFKFYSKFGPIVLRIVLVFSDYRDTFLLHS